jgi:hypothetical protein
MNGTQRRQYLLDCFSATCNRSTEWKHAKYNVAGKEVCRKAFKKITRVSHSLLKDVFLQYQDGCNRIVRKTCTRTKSERHTATIAWMKSKFNLIGDKMPHLEQVTTKHFHLHKTDLTVECSCT